MMMILVRPAWTRQWVDGKILSERKSRFGRKQYLVEWTAVYDIGTQWEFEEYKTRWRPARAIVFIPEL